MKLTDLEPEWVVFEKQKYGVDRRDNLQDAQGIMFLCPKCFDANGGPVGTHAVICWFKGRGVPDTEPPKPGRWEVSGIGFGNLTLKPSVHLSGEGGCQWHGFITNGEAKI